MTDGFESMSKSTKLIPSIAIELWTPDETHSVLVFQFDWSREDWLPTGALQWLSADEQIRGGRYRLAEHGRRFRVCRAAIRWVLGERAGIHPAAIRIQLSHQGKPHLTDFSGPAFGFNLSHAGNLALLAVSEHPDVGVDIEPICLETRRLGLARMALAPVERRTWDELAPAERDQYLLQTWIAKEAILKARGSGLDTPLDQWDLGLPLRSWTDQPQTAPIQGAPSRPDMVFPLALWRPHPGYLAAVAVAGS